jgi:hypothetical protein
MITAKSQRNRRPVVMLRLRPVSQSAPKARKHMTVAQLIINVAMAFKLRAFFTVIAEIPRWSRQASDTKMSVYLEFQGTLAPSYE